jgi:hypothetical protein
LRILITNHSLANRQGSELYVRDLAIGLLKLGHEPIAFSTRLGEVAEDIRAAGVTVTNDLNSLPAPPDIIHGQHHLETMMALLSWPGSPAIYVCHGSIPWQEAAPRFPRILRYVAVDNACRDRLLFEHAIPPDRIRVILNFVDLERFKPRAPLPVHPQRALIFSNQANEHTHVPSIRAACEHAGIQTDVVGLGMANSCAKPEGLLGDYDIVFAKGRSALEGLAVGAAVVLGDAIGAGPMVTTGNFEQLRLLNFGLRALNEPISADVIGREVARYDPKDAMAVSGLVRATAGRDKVIDQLLCLYGEVLDEYKRLPGEDLRSEEQAAATYLRGLATMLYQRDQALSKLDQAETELQNARDRLEMIANSRSWRLISRYAAIKNDHVLPNYNRLAKLWKAAPRVQAEPQSE